jgi:hypothetical protein
MKRMIVVFVLLVAFFVVGVSVAFANTIYLPIVLSEATSTPTVTPTPTSTPTPTPTVNPAPILLPNGDFEQGRAVWTEYSSYGYALIWNKDNSPSPVLPHGGNWAAWLGGANNDHDKLDQWVTIPADHPYLSFWLNIISTDTCAHDVSYVFVGNTQIDGHYMCSANNTNGWVKKVYDLRAFSGQTVDLILLVETDGNYISSIFLDDFYFQTSLSR